MKDNQLRKKLVISLGAIVVTLATVEILTRVILGAEPRPERYLLHPRMGWEWTPGYAALENDNGIEYYLEINAQGLPHSPLFTIPKPEGTFRILALGDSVTHGVGIAPENKFVYHLQQIIQEKYPDITIEVINGGTDDYNTEQEMIWLQERGLRFEPDVIILTVYMNDSRPTERPHPITTASFNFLISRSAAYYYYTQWIRSVLIEQETTQPDFRFRYRDSFRERAWVSDPVTLTQLIQSADKDWGLAWTNDGLVKLESDLLKLISFSQDQEIPLLVSVTPVAVQVYAEVGTTDDFFPLDHPQTELVPFIRSQGIPVIDLLPILRDYRSEDLFIDQAHYRANAHLIVAETLSQALVEHTLLP